MKWKSKEENVKFIAIAMLVQLINIRISHKRNCVNQAYSGRFTQFSIIPSKLKISPSHRPG